MNRRVADRASALIIALWALVLLPALRVGVKVMNANDLLTPVSNMVGLALVTGIVVAAGYGVVIITGLLTGRGQARFMALVVGVLTTLAGISLVATGLVPQLVTDPTGAAVVALACGGGPLLVVLAFVGGIELPSVSRGNPWVSPTRRPPLRPAAPMPVATTEVAPAESAGPTATADATHDYWIRGVASPDRPAPPEPFWTDLSALGWIAFAVLAGAVMLGAVWLGTRWHRGAHPLAGLALVALVLGIATQWDARRRRGAR